MFDLKQAVLTEDVNKFQTNTLDNECFTALTNSIGTITTSEVESRTILSLDTCTISNLVLWF